MVVLLLSLTVVCGLVVGFVAGASWSWWRLEKEILTLAGKRDELVGQLMAARTASEFLVSDLALARQEARFRQGGGHG